MDTQDRNPNGVETSGPSASEWLQLRSPFPRWYTWTKEVKTIVWLTSKWELNDERADAELASSIDVVDGALSHVEIWTAVEWVEWGELGRIRNIKCGRLIVLQREGGSWGLATAGAQMESTEPGVIIHPHE